jgi:hypothetical protein
MVQVDLPVNEVAATEAVDFAELRVRYASYRRRQAARLVQILPRDAVRPLYRRAREAASRDSDTDAPADDPLALLVGYCERLLPLPTFELWCEDLARNPEAHLGDLDESPGGPTVDAPSTMATQGLTYAGRRWMARLCAFRDDAFWRAYITFEDVGREHVHRTGSIFCEHDPGELRRRFLSFEPPALEAFLRSALP